MKVNDKRGSAAAASSRSSEAREDVASSSGAPPAGEGDLHGTHTEHEPDPLAERDGEGGQSLGPATLSQTPPSSAAAGDGYLEQLQRLQAEFDNYRKRMMRDQAAVGDRAAGRVIEDLLPVLDNFERAIAHGEGGEGVQLVFKDFKAALERIGLEEVPSEGAAFDPNVHEAVESREVEGLEESTIIEVYRRGYLHKGQLIRPAMVVVGRPRDTVADTLGEEEEA